MLENKRYSLKEFKELLGITKHCWETRKEELLEHLKIYFDYTIVKEGRYTYFIIKEQYAEYTPLPHKRDSEKIKQHYYTETQKIVEQDHWNTGSNIARNIIARDSHLFNHKVDTIAGYVRPIIKEKFLFEPSQAKWCRLADDQLHYESLPQEALTRLKELLQGEGRMSEEQMNVMAEWESGYITVTERDEAISGIVKKYYAAAMSTFWYEFGYRPMRVKYLEESAI